MMLFAASHAQTNILLQPAKKTIVSGKFHDIPTSRQALTAYSRNAVGELDSIGIVSQVDGTLINSQATRPSDNKTYKVIEELLKK